MGEDCDALCPADLLQLVRSRFWAQSSQAALLAGRVDDECDGIEAVSRCELYILCFSSPCYFLPSAGVLKRIKS